MKLGVLVSGNLGKTVLSYLFERYKIIFVFTDSKSDSIIDFCTTNEVDLFIGNPRKNQSKKFFINKPIDVLVSINYLFIIEKDLINHPSILAFNLHGSLLPKYRGRTPHVWAIINNEKTTGITAHLIDKGCDTGDIIDQIEVTIDYQDTGATILEKFNKLYLPLVENVLTKIEQNGLVTSPQNHLIATYFEKRTPNDGKINWNWQKERIYNWVRAQAFPYPGAFTLYENKKIVIDAIAFSNYGYNCNILNGTVLLTKPLLIKTPNGVVEITKYREINFKIVPNAILK